MPRRITCPSCLHRFTTVVPGRERRMEKLFGVPVLWAATGERYAYLTCPACGRRFIFPVLAHARAPVVGAAER